jgi:hypothetical protein
MIMSSNSISNAFSGFGKNNVRSQSSKGMKNAGLMESMKKANEEKDEKTAKNTKNAQTAQAAQTAQSAQSTQDTLTVQKNEDAPVLSEKAQAYLETLKEKFGDVNFIVGDGKITDAGSGGKKYNCFISADLIEKMAADESVAKKYEGILTDAITKVDDLKQQTEAKGLGKYVKNYNVHVADDGSVTFSAMLKNGVKDIFGRRSTEENPRGVHANSTEGVLRQLEMLDRRQQVKTPFAFHKNNTHNQFSGILITNHVTFMNVGPHSFNNFSMGVYDKNGARIMDSPFLISSNGRPMGSVTVHTGFLVVYAQPPRINITQINLFGPVKPMALKSAMHNHAKQHGRGEPIQLNANKVYTQKDVSRMLRGGHGGHHGRHGVKSVKNDNPVDIKA